MRKVKLTSPFNTGEFEMMVFDDDTCTVGSLSFTYDKARDAYIIPASLFNHRPALTLTEISEKYGISKPRLSTLLKSGRIDHIRNRAELLVFEDSFKEYLETKKNGRPKKEI